MGYGFRGSLKSARAQKKGQGRSTIMASKKVWQNRRGAKMAGAALVAAVLTGSAAVAQLTTPPGGKLKCDVEGGLSYIIGSSRALDCV